MTLGTAVFVAVGVTARYDRQDDRTFICQHCGVVLPEHQMKEVFYERGAATSHNELCPSCLDLVLVASGRDVKRVPGVRKRVGVEVNLGSSDPSTGNPRSLVEARHDPS